MKWYIFTSLQVEDAEKKIYANACRLAAQSRSGTLLNIKDNVEYLESNLLDSELTSDKYPIFYRRPVRFGNVDIKKGYKTGIEFREMSDGRFAVKVREPYTYYKKTDPENTTPITVNFEDLFNGVTTDEIVTICPTWK
jgi:hypothetical protein